MRHKGCPMNEAMHVIINGKTQTLGNGTTVSQLLEERGVQPVRVAVEINEAIVSRKVFTATEIHEGDRIEIVTLVGGG